MEAEAARVMFARSEEKLGCRYVIVVSDGDSKSYNAVKEDQPYGPDYPIYKEECINHVAKRLGTALRNLTADCSKRGLVFINKKSNTVGHYIFALIFANFAT